MSDDDYKSLVARLRDLADSLSEIYPDYAEAADAIEKLMKERGTSYIAGCAKYSNRERHATARAERAEAALHYVNGRVKRIEFLAGLDEPIREQADMAMDAIDAALAELAQIETADDA